MKKNVILAVARRDLRSWFGNPTGYVFIILFVVLAVAALLWPGEFFRNNLANLDTLNGWFPFLAIAFTAAITMGTWSTERASGTVELLLTMPARDSELLLGKYLAALGIYTVALLFTLTLPIGLSWLGSPDWGLLFSNYIGFWLFGAMLIAVTMLGSQAGDNMTVSLILGAIAGALAVFFGNLMQLVGMGSGWTVNGPRGQFAEFGRGMISMSGVLLFVGLTVTFLYLNLALLARRHYRPHRHEGLHHGLRFVAMAVGSVALTIFAVQALPRIDTTFERIHSLSDESRQLLADLDPERPVFVTTYISREVPPQLLQQTRTLTNLVDQFDRIGGAAVQQRVVLTEQFSPEAKDAEKNFGIRPSRMVIDEGGVLTEVTAFLGFVVQSGTEEVVVPFVEPGVPLEYELTRSIRVAAQAERRTVGVLKTDVELYGGFDFQSFRQKPRWQIVDELMLQYEVENVDPDSDYPDNIDALLVPQASSLTQPQMDRLQGWLGGGGKAVLLEDPAPVDPGAAGTAATDPKGGQQNRFGGQQGPQKGNFANLLGSIGLRMPTDQVVWDLSYRTFQGGAIPHPEFLFLDEKGFDATNLITSGLDRAVVLLGGHVKEQARDGFSYQPLLQSPRPESAQDLNGLIPKLEVFAFNPFGGGQQIDPRRRHRPAPAEYVIAARTTGPETDGKQTDVILVADLDMFSNDFFRIRRSVMDPNMRFDNVTFVLNCIDSLVGDESLIELRKRRPVLRKLERVEEAQRDFETAWIMEKDMAEIAAKAELDEAQARLDAAVAKVRENQQLDEQAKEIQIQTIQDNENRKFEIAKEQIEEDKRELIDQARHVRDSQKLGLYNGYRWLMLLIAPLPALLMGFVTWGRRRAREQAIVPDNRKVG